MKKILTAIPLLCALLAQHSAHAQDWTWTGAVSPNWGDMGNWTNTSNNTFPADAAALSNRNVRITGAGFLPANQNIPNLFLNGLEIAPSTTEDTHISGEPFAISWFNYQAESQRLVVISNDIAFAANYSASMNIRANTHFYGTLSEFGGSRYYNHHNTAGPGNVHFRGPVLFSGGINNSQGSINYYGVETAGAVLGAGTNRPAFFTGGTHAFRRPSGMDVYEYDITPEKGASTGFTADVESGATVVFNAPVAGGGNLSKNGGGILELNAATNTFTGAIAPGNGLLIVRGGLARGNNVTNPNADNSIDLDGVDMLGRNMGFWNQGGQNSDGIYRNQNPDKPSRIDGNISNMGNGNGNKFGGVGTLIFSGDITSGGSGISFQKTGPGTLVMTGSTVYPGGAGIFGGTLVFDYSVTNVAKLAEYQSMRLVGNLVLRGNGDDDTSFTSGTLNFGEGNDDRGRRVRISLAGTNDNAVTFRFRFPNNSWELLQGRSAVDFAPGNDGFFYATNWVNYASNMTPTALPPRFTYDGASFARVSETIMDADHYHAIIPLDVLDYQNDLATAPVRTFVDVAGDVVYTRSPYDIGAIRFNAPASLTLNNHLNITGENGAGNNGYLGAILVTPGAGFNDIEINGNFNLCHNGENGALTIHQYNTNAALVINTRVNNNTSTRLVKTGPGELVLNHTNSTFSGLYVYEGTVTFPAIANVGVNSPVGRGINDGNFSFLLGDATLCYKGTDPEGHSTDRAIRLRGFGILDASGTGPLTFMRENLIDEPYTGKNQLLTLSGARGGRGVIKGSLNGLNGGRLRKRGEGEWTLTSSSTNSIIWGAEIFDGTLIVNGSLGRDVTVHAGGTLAGTGRIQRNLIIKDGGILSLDPDAPMTVGKNLILAEGAVLKLPKNLPNYFIPLLYVEGKIMDEFANPPPHAFVKYENGVLSAKFRPVGTLFLIK